MGEINIVITWYNTKRHLGSVYSTIGPNTALWTYNSAESMLTRRRKITYLFQEDVTGWVIVIAIYHRGDHKIKLAGVAVIVPTKFIG